MCNKRFYSQEDFFYHIKQCVQVQIQTTEPIVSVKYELHKEPSADESLDDTIVYDPEETDDADNKDSDIIHQAGN